MEVCVDSVESAVSAVNGGANRIELCTELSNGGLTPSLGLYRRVKGSVRGVPIFVIIRPRGGDFYYTGEEMEVMKEDIKIFKEENVDGMVLGILRADGSVDEDRCTELLTLSHPLPVTFHRAFDMSYDLSVALETIISLGFSRVLTSGGRQSAQDGSDVIRELIKQAAGRIIVMPGGGINTSNLQSILEGSGAVEFHGSASVLRDSSMQYRNESLRMGSAPDFSIKVTDSNIVASLISIAKKFIDNKIVDHAY